MTTPPEEPADTTPPRPAPAPAETTAPAGTTPPAAALPPPPPGDQAVFAPIPRAPRIPWVNPARRGHVLAAAIVAALVLLGGGIGIGAAIGSGGHHRHGPEQMYRGGYGPGMQGGGIYVVPGRPMPYPGKKLRRHMQLPAVSTPATPSPSSTK
jgi:hypothetical protein